MMKICTTLTQPVAAGLLMAFAGSLAAHLQEFIALVKSKPAQLNYASAGSKALEHC